MLVHIHLDLAAVIESSSIIRSLKVGHSSIIGAQLLTVLREIYSESKQQFRILLSKLKDTKVETTEVSIQFISVDGSKSDIW